MLSNRLIDLKISTAENKLKYAKPSRKYMRQFGQGDLEISGSTIDFLMYLSPYIDHDCRIMIELEQAKYALFMQTNTFNRVMEEIKNFRLVVKKGEHYYSRFHILTDGSGHEFNYIKPLSVFTSDKLMNYSLRHKRLFYYIATVTWLGSWQAIAIENLYKNKLNKKGQGVTYFDSFQQAFNALLKLVSDGLIEIKININSNNHKYGTLINNKTPNYEKLLYQYLTSTGYHTKNNTNSIDLKTRKPRTSKLQMALHTLYIRVNKEILNQEIKLSASQEEFIQLAKNNNIAVNEINNKSINILIGYKNELVKNFGSLGLSIYRKTLKNFLKDHSDKILYYDALGKLANYYMDFYLLNEIKNILVHAAYHQKWMPIAMNNSYPGINENTIINCGIYKVELSTVAKLLNYFTSKSSINHKIILDGELLEKKISYADLAFDKTKWKRIKKEVEIEYRNKREYYINNDNITRPIYYSPAEWRKFMIHCAQEGLFVQKEKFDKIIRSMIESESKPLQSVERKTTKFKLYNWLVERE